MDQNRTQGKVDQMKGRIKEAAGALTDDDSLKNEGKFDKLTGKLREGYGKMKDELRAEKERQDEARTYDPDEA